jgi:hypothetical protein
MPQSLHSFPFEDALARSNDVFELEFTDWGVRSDTPGAVTPEINLQWPPPGSRPVPSSVAAVAIGPRSTIDRCWYTWDRLKTLNIPPADVMLPELVVSLPRIITREAPLLFSQATQKEPTLGTANQSWWDAMQAGTAYVFPWGPKPSNNDLAQGVGANGHGGQFGTTTGYYAGQQFTNMFGVTGAFTPTEAPFLHLQFYAKLPAFSPPTKRAAMAREGLWGLGAGNSGYFAMIPIYGRKSIGISLLSHNFDGIPAQIVDYRVGLIRNINEHPVGSFTPVFEVKAFEQLAAPADVPVNVQLTNPCADYLSVHITNGNVGPAGGAWTIVAED